MELPAFPELEARPYGPESTQKEIEALRARVFVLDERIIYLKQVAVHSVYQLDLMFEQLISLRSRFDEWYLIIDLTQVHQPSPEIRDYIRQKLITMGSPKIITIVIGDNSPIGVAARFILGHAVKTPYTIVKTVDQALNEIQVAMNA